MKTTLIDLVIKHTGFNQTNLAEKIGVSRAQISKWKAGEAIPYERKQSLTKLAGLFTDDVEWLAIVENQQNSDAWLEYVLKANEVIDARPMDKLNEMPESEIPEILIQLNEAGISIPSCPPALIECDLEGEVFMEFDDDDHFGSLLVELLEYYNIYDDWVNHHLTWVDDIHEIQSLLICLTLPMAIRHISDDHLSAVSFDENKYRVFTQKAESDCKDEIRLLCDELVRRGIPITIDYYDFINKHPHGLQDDIDFVDLYSERRILQHLPYGEQLMLDHIQGLEVCLVDLHKKVDKILEKL